MAKETKTMRNMFHLSFGEEVGNAITHGVMAILCLFFLPFAAVYSYIIALLRSFDLYHLSVFDVFNLHHLS